MLHVKPQYGQNKWEYFFLSKWETRVHLQQEPRVYQVLKEQIGQIFWKKLG